ncbi:MAG: glycosyltransferase family 4 protein [Hyphomicrobiaceae bacterium]|nr:glycosyltransferase family 4 protein [Hyphomicrobiaceae bacterium]
MLPELTQADSLRVFMTADAVGGVWQYSLDLAQGLRAYDTETTLCVLGPSPRTEQLAAARRIPGLKLICLDLPLDWTADSPDEVLEAAAAVASVARAEGGGVIHLNSPVLAAGPRYPVPVVAVCHSCIATWWQAVRARPLARQLRWHKDLVASGLARADAIIAPSGAFARFVSQTYKLPVAPTVVYNGRRPCMRQSLPEGTAVPEAPFAFTAGRLWDEGKNLRALDAAAARLSLPVLAAGPLRGPNRASISFSHVQPLGSLTDGHLAEWLAAKPIFVSTARYEPFGLAVLEAAEAGCALVLSDIATFRELWEGAACFVPPDDEMAVASAIELLAGDARQRTLMASAARRRARRYTAEVMAAKVRAIYGGLLSRKRQRSGSEVMA